ncbi:4'-phosphopantetheinyl transferase [Parabacteroides sp. PF5-5]|uniref:4'-phosphopantetheinyl transferase family protein n=1 Tax=unclassified Parabacteroides TaxID=2649774 RepID=UPI0024742DAA|nr:MULTISPECIES: 4'-phosphopantetheinyl transferase family protein [unclassified Parabacteroides]MDH6306668.1 4'-phosphopantetheinyl transferase [Parabacteroides sp. PH5-39]MDH6317635.1 4'-phosphopantetheinyl transferase [Parabacteroides sp. PF5-13]MDH6321379.1 4'-phosphopantetheinyl transferase [Parabacteroides sp. PH5-13]MDH6328765.1 4'-phosphopantetheinyl transferase [Parabacteroides sp. PH5-41]MDH6336567.1 4'-phosphopantetheinyl transferase [Parabacteroides sp. PF5-5]
MGIWKVEESSDHLLSMLENTSDYLPFLERVQFEHRKREWLAVRVLLKELLGEESLIAYYDDGAPCLSAKDLNISISHTKDYVAVLLSPRLPVGIDIEYRGKRILNVRSRFLSEEESDFIDAKQEIEHLLICWCAKETLFKVMRQQEVDFIRHLHLLPFPYNTSGSLTGTETRTQQAAAYHLNYRVFDDFVLAFTTELSEGHRMNQS